MNTELFEQVKANVPLVNEAGYNKGLTDVVEKQEEFLADKPQTYYDAFWDAYQDYGNRKSYRYAFCGNAWADIDLAKEMKYDIKIVDTSTSSRCAIGMFFNFNRDGGDNLYDMTELCKRLDFSGCIDAGNIFCNARADKITVDFSNATSLNSTFAGGDGGGAVETLTLKITNKCSSFSSTFNYCNNLKNLTFMEGSEIVASLNLKWSTSLTKASIENVINTLSSSTSGLTLTLPKTAVNNAFTAEEWNALIATRSNWTISLV
jgi:hypothetical protein